MQEIELSAGIIEYEDTGGSGPVIVLLSGLAMGSSLWRHVVRELLTQREIRRDLLKYLRGYTKGDLLAAAERLRSFDRPALVIWAVEDRVMSPEHGRRFAKLLPRARLVEIADSYTLIPEGQPAQLAAHIRAFVASEPITATEARPIAPQP